MRSCDDKDDHYDGCHGLLAVLVVYAGEAEHSGGAAYAGAS